MTRFDGDLTFDFGSDFRIVIPNNHLVVPERSFGDNGQIYSNDTRSVLRINALQDINSRSFPRLGRYFVSMVYLLYNDGAKQFTMWEANPTSITDLVAINSEGDEVDSASFCSGVPSSTTTPQEPPEIKEDEGTSSNTPESSNASGQGLSTGVIAGIAVGGAVVLLGVFCGSWFLWKRKSAKAELATSQPTKSQRALGQYYWGDDPKDLKPPLYDGGIGFPSQACPHYIPQEMPANQQPRSPRYELG